MYASFPPAGVCHSLWPWSHDAHAMLQDRKDDELEKYSHPGNDERRHVDITLTPRGRSWRDRIMNLMHQPNEQWHAAGMSRPHGTLTGCHTGDRQGRRLWCCHRRAPECSGKGVERGSCVKPCEASTCINVPCLSSRHCHACACGSLAELELRNVGRPGMKSLHCAYAERSLMMQA